MCMGQSRTTRDHQNALHTQRCCLSRCHAKEALSAGWRDLKAQNLWLNWAPGLGLILAFEAVEYSRNFSWPEKGLGLYCLRQ